MRLVKLSARSIALAARQSAARIHRGVVVLGVAVLGIIPFQAHGLRAAQLIQYMQVPASGAFSSPTTFTLPNYGNVQVSIAGTSATYFDQLNGYNQAAGPYFWGTDTQRLGILNSTSAPLGYTLNFAFLSGAPNPADLALVVVGLASGTTATVSQPGSLVGEYTFPPSGFYPGGPSSTTILSSQTFSSLGNADPLNTGWALYEPTGIFTTMSLSVNQISGDGIGFTLGYTTPEPSSLVLCAMGAVGLLGMSICRRRRAQSTVLGLLTVVMALGTSGTAFAQPLPAPGTPLAGVPGFTIQFDEQGNSLLNGGPNPNPVTLIAGGGIEFFLPGPVTPGDVLIRGLSDISAVNNGISDLLSFSNNTANQGILSYFSLIDDASEVEPADVLSFNLNTPYGAIEFGPEGMNSFTWIPDMTNPLGAFYNGISDGLIPEPSSFILGALGLIALFLIGLRRRRTAV
jgi:MYXO-CTERM domain-containing protein